MLKPIAFFLVGAVPAAAVTWSLVDTQTAADDAPAAAEPRATAVTSQPSAPAASTAVDRPNPLPSAYRAAADIADAATLERQLAAALAEPFSIDRNARIEALFMRLAELDLRRALRFASLPAFDQRIVADVFQAWAQHDREAALRAIATVGDAETRIEIALALLEAFGEGAESIELIAGSLPEVQRIDFQAEVLARRAETDPNGALSAALSLRDPASRNTAVQRIGAVWTERDPLAAITRVETLPRELQDAYRDSVAVEWARQDVAGFLTYADSLPTLDSLRAGMAQAMAVDPMRLFDIASRHPPVPIGPPFPANITVDRTSFTAVVQGDPQWGIRYLDTITDPQRRNSFRASIAETWGRTDPRAALAWARSYDPPEIPLIGTIVWSASMVDIDMSIDWMLDFEKTHGQPPPPGVAGNLATFVVSDPRRKELANRLRASTEPAAVQLLTRVSAQWVQTDPAGALDWMLEGGSAVDPALASTVAGQLANRDAALAASYLERMPPELKGAWLEQVAAPYARQNPTAAASWIAQFRAEPNYETIMQRVVQASAQADPEGASRLLQVAPESIQANLAQNVATAWAQQDLAGAARWAATLVNPDVQTRAVGTVVSAWATRDPQAAQRWVLTLPKGATRDRALQSLVSRFSRPDFRVPIERSLIDAFESPQMRQAAETMAQRPR